MKAKEYPHWTRVVLDFSYDKGTGNLFWKEAGQGRNLKRPAGHISKLSGYRIISYNGKQHPAQDLVWLRHQINPPVGFIRHFNKCRTDNRIENLYDDGICDFL